MDIVNSRIYVCAHTTSTDLKTTATCLQPMNGSSMDSV